MGNNSADADLRNAAFLWLSRVTDGGELPVAWQQLSQGFKFRGEVVHLRGQKGIWKPAGAKLPISITTAPPKPGHSAPYDDGITDDGLLRYRYEGTDASLHTNVSLRTCWRNQIPLIYLHGIDKGLYLATWPVMITADHPSELCVDVAMADPQRIRPDLSVEVATEADQRYYTTLTKQRLDQATFRHQVLRAYRTQCAMCHLRHSELLDAAHIVPYADNGPSEIRNGMALCKIHHAAFDHHLVGVRPDYVIQLRPDLLDEQDGPMLRYGLQASHGQKLILPRRTPDRPGAQFLERRWAQFQSA